MYFGLFTLLLLVGCISATREEYVQDLLLNRRLGQAILRDENGITDSYKLLSESQLKAEWSNAPDSFTQMMEFLGSVGQIAFVDVILSSHLIRSYSLVLRVTTLLT